MTTLTTERLRLRPFASSDLAAFMTIAGDWPVARMTADLPSPLTPEDAASWLEPEKDCVRFAIERNGDLIGGIGFFLREGTQTGHAQPSLTGELGFFLARQVWGKGYALEAARAVIAHGFEHQNLSQFSSAHFIDNAPSAKLLAKLGFQQSHRSSHWCEARGEPVQSICYNLPRGRRMTLPQHKLFERVFP